MTGSKLTSGVTTQKRRKQQVSKEDQALKNLASALKAEKRPLPMLYPQTARHKRNC